MVKRLFATVFFVVQCVFVFAQDISTHLENIPVRRYLYEVNYTPDDESLIDDYCVKTGYRLDQPQPASIPVPEGLDVRQLSLYYSTDESFSKADSVYVVSNDSTAFLIYNLIPQKTYYYRIVDRNEWVVAEGHIKTRGQLRMIYVPSLFNVRDLGGWPTASGGRIRYGMIFRGSEMNGLNIADSTDIHELLRLGVKAELDFRYEGERDEVDAAGFSALGFSREDGNYLCTSGCGCYATHMYHSYYTSRYKLSIDYIVRSLKAGQPVYMHCIWGADRTGMISLLIEGLLGVSYSDLAKDYELTSMSEKSGIRKKTLYFDDIIANIRKESGNSLRENFFNYMRRIVGVSKDNLDYLCEVLLEDYVAEQVLQGDVNEDNVVDIADVVFLYNFMAGKNADVSLRQADVNGDGAVDIADIVKIYNLMAGESVF